MSQFYISAAHKSSGKTTISIGLSAALSEHYKVQVFKKGPDYIDPMWLQQASGQAVYNLDFYTSSHHYIVKQYKKYQQQSQITFVKVTRDYMMASVSMVLILMLLWLSY